MLLKVKKTIYNILIYYKVIYSCDSKAEFAVSKIFTDPKLLNGNVLFFPISFSWEKSWNLGHVRH